MGKKSKKGKQRRDTFYFRAKDAGYRARAAYKLIQLNKRFNFLSSARVCIDLCAAPGSWMQVASKFMPVSSVVIGVDRYSIPHIPNTISIQGDITTEAVRQELKSNLRTWKADVVLHDGAPHVGQNWIQDAYDQNLLVLHAFKLACEFLQKGGTFVTKVFRSKDHLSLQYVFRKLFKKVEATKPVASRLESAEIFVVCQSFLSPDKVDPEFFDPRYVFQTVESETKTKINILKPGKVKKVKAHGYEDGITMLFKKKNISEFIESTNYIDVLEETNEFEWDLPFARESVHTTNEILEFCKDVKVLSMKDLRSLIAWRKAVKAEIQEVKKSKATAKKKEDNVEEKDEIDEEFDELDKIQEEITKLKTDKLREERRKRKRVDKKKKLLEEKMKYRLLVPGDPGPQETGQDGLFTLETLNNIDNVDQIMDNQLDILADSDSNSGDSSDDEETKTKKRRLEHYSKEGSYLDSTGTYYKTANDSASGESDDDEGPDSDEEGLQMERENAKEEKKRKKKEKKVTFEDSDDEPDDDTGKTNPLITDLVGDQPKDKRLMKAETWFSKIMCDDIETEEVEDYELKTAIKNCEDKGLVLKQRTNVLADAPSKRLKKKRIADEGSEDGSDSEEESDTDSDSGLEKDEENEKAEDAPSEPKKKKKKEPGLTALGKALATKMIHSKKAERDLYDDGWNRYMWGDENLPRWFEIDEEMHNRPKINVDKEDLAMYEERNKSVNARTIKKVVEAKARKQRRLRKRLAKVRKKAEVVTNNAEMSASDKAAELKKIYKKVTAVKPKQKSYIIMKRSFGGKRPKGVKGPSRMVDRRLKKDKRSAQKQQKGNKKKGR